jgi:hypothetical protein
MRVIEDMKVTRLELAVNAGKTSMRGHTAAHTKIQVVADPSGVLLDGKYFVPIEKVIEMQLEEATEKPSLRRKLKEIIDE